ncbi:hypothetical protein HZB88_04480 [archaeon]|nr:hypothetical protein [archaeon]
MAQCRYCREGDESKLTMSTRNLNGKVQTIDICLPCFWLDKFKAEGEDGKALSEGCERADKGIESARDINLLGLQE